MPTLIRFHKTGGPEVLQYDQVPARPLQPDEIRLKVEAIGLNRAEIMFRSGQYVETPELPALLGYEAAGVVEEVGSDVKGLKPGDRAASIPGFSMNHYGTYGDSVVLPASIMVKTPDRLSSIEAAACWMQYCTAYMLIEFGGMKRGDTVLITAAASSVGQAAIQLANAVGATPIATTRNAGKVQALLDAGASAVINTKESNLVEEVRRLTNGKGANIIFDPVVGPQLEALCEAAAPSAQIFLYGLLDPRPVPFPLLAALSKDLTHLYLQADSHHWKSGTAGTREDLDIEAARKRRVKADDRAHISLQPNGRSTSLHGVERTDRQDCSYRPMNLACLWRPQPSQT